MLKNNFHLELLYYSKADGTFMQSQFNANLFLKDISLCNFKNILTITYLEQNEYILGSSF